MRTVVPASDLRQVGAVYWPRLRTTGPTHDTVAIPDPGGTVPRYFIDTDDGFHVQDEEGHRFPDAETLRRTVRHALAEMIREADGNAPVANASAVVRDETGRCVMRARLTLVVDAAD